MKFALHTSASLIVSALLARAAYGAELTITVPDIETPQGHLMIAVFDSAEAFDEGGDAFKGLRVAVDAAEISVTVDDLAPGRYAIKLYHDANDNGNMDTNAAGIPTETYGFSSNKGRFGPPPFEVAAVEVAEDQDNTTVIKLR